MSENPDIKRTCISDNGQYQQSPVSKGNYDFQCINPLDFP